MKSPSKRLLITGVSSGLGKAFAEVALEHGHHVVGVVRTRAALQEFEQLHPVRVSGHLLDVTDLHECAPVVDEIERNQGPIDVLVNNAGYGHEGTVEESALSDLKRQFDVNVFGAVAMMKAVLPYMRQRRSGHIVNITSMGGFITMPGLGFYHGSKFALEGISESLAKEVRPFGIRVTAVEPGAMRTDWAGRSMMRAPRTIADYDEVFEPLRKRRLEMNGQQLGDPVKAAHALMALLEAADPPMHLLLGTDALRLVSEKLELLRREMDEWREVSASTDFS